MNLRYITFSIEDTSGYDTNFISEFQFRTRFISNFLSKEVRKLRLVTDGTFDLIAVAPTPNTTTPCRVIGERALVCEVPFELARYESVKGTENCEYYLELFEVGFRRASHFKSIPEVELIGLLEKFRNAGYRNEWVQKRGRFKDHDIDVIVRGSFTTHHITMSVSLSKISTKLALCSGPIIMTLPDEVFIDGAVKDILMDDGNIVITDFLDQPTFDIPLHEIERGNFLFRYHEGSETAESLRKYTLLK